MEVTIGVVVAVVVVVLLILATRIVKQWEQGVVLRFGRLVSIRNPGLNFILPLIDHMIKVDLRVITFVLEPQEVITGDNVTIRVDAVVYFKVLDPRKAVVVVEDYMQATIQIALTTLRSVLGQSHLDEVLAHREQINQRLRDIIDEQTEDPWGVRVVLVEVKDVLLPEVMQRAMAKQAEAEREKRAKIIHAEGENEAAGTLANAARIISTEPAALQLRYLQTLVEIAGEKSSTIIPLPLEVLNGVLQGTTDALRGLQRERSDAGKQTR